MAIDSDHEAYILLLLADGNLPTGSFVASSGLESYVTHGFSVRPSPASAQTKTTPLDAVMDFVRDSLSTYARSALSFVSDAHTITEHLLNLHSNEAYRESRITSTMKDIKSLDAFYQAMTLNHVVRRASEQQGVALLSLYSKGFTRPTSLTMLVAAQDTPETTAGLYRDTLAAEFVDKLKLSVRKGEIHGHQPVCWGVLTAALELSLGMFRHKLSLPNT